MKHTKKIISGFIAMSMALSVAAPAELISLSDVLTVKAAQVGQTFKVAGRDTQFKEDNVDGYSYEVWLDQTGGSGSMTLGNGGTFSTEWSAQVSKGNFLARRGRNYDATKKATEYGPIVMDYAADYSASSQGNSRLCVYGWMKNPLVEARNRKVQARQLPSTVLNTRYSSSTTTVLLSTVQPKHSSSTSAFVSQREHQVLSQYQITSKHGQLQAGTSVTLQKLHSTSKAGKAAVRLT